MGSPRLAAAALLALTGALATTLLAVAPGSPAAAAGTPAHFGAPSKPQSKAAELWATVDVCNAPRHPDTIGIRGSMPGDGHRARHDVHALPRAEPRRDDAHLG